MLLEYYSKTSQLRRHNVQKVTIDVSSVEFNSDAISANVENTILSLVIRSEECVFVVVPVIRDEDEIPVQIRDLVVTSLQTVRPHQAESEMLP